MSDPIKQRIGITLSVLLLLSVLLNVYLYNKSLKYKGYETAENKLYFGEQGRFSNYYQQQFHQLSNMHSQLTLLYGPLHAYDEYNKISSIGTHNMFNMFVDFSVFFDHLGRNYFESMTSDEEGQYLVLSQLDTETRDGIQIIADIMGELDSLRASSCENSSDDVKALEQYLKQSSAYFYSEEVQDKVRMIQAINKKLER